MQPFINLLFLVFILTPSSGINKVRAQDISLLNTRGIGNKFYLSIDDSTNFYFAVGDIFLDLYRADSIMDIDNYNSTIAHYQKGLMLAPDNIYYHNRLGYAFHLERRLKEASREYAKVLELDPPKAITPEEYDLALKLAPRVYTQPNEFFNLEDVVVIFHPQQPIIEYSFFWDDDIDYPEDNDPTDHEKVWIEYNLESGTIVNVYTYFHRAILSTKESLKDAKENKNRARINIQWGGHGSLPVGWETIPSEQISVKYTHVDMPDEIEDMKTRYYKHIESIKNPNHPLAKDWPKIFKGSWAEYTTFTKYVDLPKMIKKKKMIMKSRWSNAVIDQYFLDYQFYPKIEWPLDAP